MPSLANCVSKTETHFSFRAKKKQFLVRQKIFRVLTMPIFNERNDFLLHDVYTTTERYNFEPVTLEPYTLPDVDFDEVKGVIISGFIFCRFLNQRLINQHDYQIIIIPNIDTIIKLVCLLTAAIVGFIAIICICCGCCAGQGQTFFMGRTFQSGDIF